MTETYDDLRTTIEAFEAKLFEALEFKYRGNPAMSRKWLIEMSPVTTIDIGQFLEVYLEQDSYPHDRLKPLVYHLMDIKIQMFYIMELDLGLYNHLIYDLGFVPDAEDTPPYLVLRKLSLDQNLIMKSRILWERIMNLVYFLETGKGLEAKGRSKKTRFFRFVEGTPWAFLEDYREYIEWFDDNLRTPEVHKGSIFRKHFQADSHVPQDKISALLNIIINFFYPTLLEIVQGHKVSTRYWVAGMGTPLPDLPA